MPLSSPPSFPPFLLPSFPPFFLPSFRPSFLSSFPPFLLPSFQTSLLPSFPPVWSYIFFDAIIFLIHLFFLMHLYFFWCFSPSHASTCGFCSQNWGTPIWTHGHAIGFFLVLLLQVARPLIFGGTNTVLFRDFRDTRVISCAYRVCAWRITVQTFCRPFAGRLQGQGRFAFEFKSYYEWTTISDAIANGSFKTFPQSGELEPAVPI